MIDACIWMSDWRFATTICYFEEFRGPIFPLHPLIYIRAMLWNLENSFDLAFNDKFSQILSIVPSHHIYKSICSFNACAVTFAIHSTCMFANCKEWILHSYPLICWDVHLMMTRNLLLKRRTSAKIVWYSAHSSGTQLTGWIFNLRG